MEQNKETLNNIENKKHLKRDAFYFLKRRMK